MVVPCLYGEVRVFGQTQFSHLTHSVGFLCMPQACQPTEHAQIATAREQHAGHGILTHDVPQIILISAYILNYEHIFLYPSHKEYIAYILQCNN